MLHRNAMAVLTLGCAACLCLPPARVQAQTLLPAPSTQPAAAFRFTIQAGNTKAGPFAAQKLAGFSTTAVVRENATGTTASKTVSPTLQPVTLTWATNAQTASIAATINKLAGEPATIVVTMLKADGSPVGMVTFTGAVVTKLAGGALTAGSAGVQTTSMTFTYKSATRS